MGDLRASLLRQRCRAPPPYVFLEINDASVAAASDDDAYTLVMEVAETELALDVIANRLRHLVG